MYWVLSVDRWLTVNSGNKEARQSVILGSTCWWGRQLAVSFVNSRMLWSKEGNGEEPEEEGLGRLLRGDTAELSTKGRWR